MTYFFPKKLKNFSKSTKKRTFLLLEVLIAFVLLVLCALPLFYPHAYMLQVEKNFVHLIEIDRAVDLVYAEILDALYRNEVPWEDIQGGSWHEINHQKFNKHDPILLKKIPYQGRYRIVSLSDKGQSSGASEHYHLLEINIKFKPKGKSNEKELDYSYRAFVTRKIPVGKEGVP